MKEVKAKQDGKQNKARSSVFTCESDDRLKIPDNTRTYLSDVDKVGVRLSRKSCVARPRKELEVYC